MQILNFLFFLYTGTIFEIHSVYQHGLINLASNNLVISFLISSSISGSVVLVFLLYRRLDCPLIQTFRVDCLDRLLTLIANLNGASFPNLARETFTIF